MSYRQSVSARMDVRMSGVIVSGNLEEFEDDDITHNHPQIYTRCVEKNYSTLTKDKN